MGGLKNLLMMVVDCLGSDALLGAGKSALTPSIDGLCEKGISFPNAIAAATYTTPSVASLLTGLYPSVHGVRSLGNDKLPRQCRSLASMLKEKGYETAAFVTGVLGEETGLDQGFNRYEFRDIDDVVFGEWGQRFLEAVPLELREPWFAFVHLWELHRPQRVAPACASRAYGRTPYERALSSIDAFVGKLLANVDVRKTVIVLTSDHGERLPRGWMPALRRVLKEAINSCSLLRGLMGKMTGPRRLPMKIRHLGMVGHGYHVYDVLARVPLVIADVGGLTGGRIVLDQVRTVDVVPTVLDLFGVGSSAMVGCQGVSLVRLASGDELDLPPAIIEAIRSPGARMVNTDLLIGVRTAEWKLAFAVDNPAIPWELYSLANDPAEKHNVADTFPHVAEDLHSQALKILQEGEQLRRPGEALSPEEKVRVEKRLRQLGYL